MERVLHHHLSQFSCNCYWAKTTLSPCISFSFYWIDSLEETNHPFLLVFQCTWLSVRQLDSDQSTPGVTWPEIAGVTLPLSVRCGSCRPLTSGKMLNRTFTVSVGVVYRDFSVICLLSIFLWRSLLFKKKFSMMVSFFSWHFHWSVITRTFARCKRKITKNNIRTSARRCTSALEHRVFYTWVVRKWGQWTLKNQNYSKKPKARNFTWCTWL